MSRYWSPFVQELEPYVPGEQPAMADPVKLNTNENPYGPPPSVQQAMRDAVDARLRLYPHPDGGELRTALADYHGLNTDQVFLGNGSDEVLAHIFLALFKQNRPLILPDITYSFYRVYCGLYGIDYETVPLADDFSLPLDAFPADNGGIIFANPNAPTGLAVTRDDIAALLERNTESVVVVDEAYVDFGAESAIALVRRFPNLLVTRTLSKGRSLAGLRIGYAVGSPDLIAGLDRVKNCFNSYPLDQVAIAAGVASLRDETFFENTVDAIISERDLLADELRGLGFRVLPSAANFLFVCHERFDAGGLATALRERGIIIRHFERPERIAGWLRITVGTPEQHQVLLDALRELLKADNKAP